MSFFITTEALHFFLCAFFVSFRTLFVVSVNFSLSRLPMLSHLDCLLLVYFPLELVDLLGFPEFVEQDQHFPAV